MIEIRLPTRGYTFDRMADGFARAARTRAYERIAERTLERELQPVLASMRSRTPVRTGELLRSEKVERTDEGQVSASMSGRRQKLFVNERNHGIIRNSVREHEQTIRQSGGRTMARQIRDEAAREVK